MRQSVYCHSNPSLIRPFILVLIVVLIIIHEAQFQRKEKFHPLELYFEQNFARKKDKSRLIIIAIINQNELQIRIDVISQPGPTLEKKMT